MTIGPDPMIRILWRSARFGIRAPYSSTRPYTTDVSGAASSRLYSTSSRRPPPTHTTCPSPHTLADRARLERGFALRGERRPVGLLPRALDLPVRDQVLVHGSDQPSS